MITATGRITMIGDTDEGLDAWAYQLQLEQQQYEENMKTSEMMQGKYIKQKDVGQGVLVTIKGLSSANVAMDNKPPDVRYLMHFFEIEKPLVLRTTNIQLCEKIFQSDESDSWLNKKIVLYADPNVSFGGELTGGVRVRAPRTSPTSAQQADTQRFPVETPKPSVDFDDDLPF